MGVVIFKVKLVLGRNVVNGLKPRAIVHCVDLSDHPVEERLFLMV